MKKTTITYYGVEFEVTYDFTPQERTVWNYGDGSGYPGAPAYVELNSISHKGDDMTELLEDKIDEREEIILNTETE